MTDLRPYWPLEGHDDLRDALRAAYGDAGRGYHDLLHLTEVLVRIDELSAHEACDLPTVRLAAWFHDAVYDGRPDDEERSARWALDAVADSGRATEVARLVRLTERHDPGPGDHDGAVLCDADLAILAADGTRYEAYTTGVRREYAHLDDATFAAGRIAVLRTLLEGPLFTTAYAREQWEEVARRNMGAEIEFLLGAVPGSG